MASAQRRGGSGKFAAEGVDHIGWVLLGTPDATGNYGGAMRPRDGCVLCVGDAAALAAPGSAKPFAGRVVALRAGNSDTSSGSGSGVGVPVARVRWFFRPEDLPGVTPRKCGKCHTRGRWREADCVRWRLMCM